MLRRLLIRGSGRGINRGFICRLLCCLFWWELGYVEDCGTLGCGVSLTVRREGKGEIQRERRIGRTGKVVLLE